MRLALRRAPGFCAPFIELIMPSPFGPWMMMKTTSETWARAASPRQGRRADAPRPDAARTATTVFKPLSGLPSAAATASAA